MDMPSIRKQAKESNATITDKKRIFKGQDDGFSVRFENGYYLSVFIGSHSYTLENRNSYDCTRKEISTMEIAIMYGGEWAIFADDVVGYVSCEKLPDIIDAIAREDWHTVIALAENKYSTPPTLKKEVT